MLIAQATVAYGTKAKRLDLILAALSTQTGQSLVVGWKLAIDKKSRATRRQSRFSMRELILDPVRHEPFG